MLKRLALIFTVFVVVAYGGWRWRDHAARRALSIANELSAGQLDAALEQRVTLDVREMPMRKVLAQLERETGVAIDVDATALRNEGIARDPRVTLSVKDVPLRSALRNLIRQVSQHLAFTTHGDGLLVTSRDAADANVSLRLYPLSPLLVGPEGVTEEQFQDAVESCFAPEFANARRQSWPTNGGTLTRATPQRYAGPEAVERVPGGLAVVHTREAHRQIKHLLEALQTIELDPDRIEPLPLDPPSAEELRIAKVLSEPAEIDVQNASIHDIVEKLSARYSVPIHFDESMNENLLFSSKISMRIAGVSLHTILQHLPDIDSYGIDIHDNAVWLIDGDEIEKNHRHLIIYPTGDLLWPRGGYDREQLAEIVSSTVAPTSWTQYGGQCALNSCGHALVVNADSYLHREIATLLQTLRRHAAGDDPLMLVAPRRHELETLLKQPASVDFRETPLKEVMEEITSKYRIPILLDIRALDGAGVTPETPLTFRSAERPLAAVLYDLLHYAELTWTIREDDCVLFTTTDEVYNALNTVVYDVRHLVAPDFGRADDDSLMEIITSIVQPTSWTDVGGTGAIQYGDGCLVLSQTDDVHADIAKLFAMLERLYDEPDQIRPMESPSLAPDLDKAIQKKLDQVVSLKQLDVTLSQLAATLEQEYGVPVLLDSMALDGAGVAAETKCGVECKNISLRSAIRLLLRSLELTFFVRDGVLVFTTTDEVSNELYTRVYNVADLVVSTPKYPDFDELIESITSAIQPTSWTDVGGTGQIQEYESPFAKALVISQTADAFEEIDRHLAALRHQRFPGRYPEPPGSDADRKIDEVLRAKTDLVCEPMSLGEFARRLSEQWGVSVVLDHSSLSNARQIECDLHDVTGSDALATVLTVEGLDFGRYAESLLICSGGAGNMSYELLEARTYAWNAIDYRDTLAPDEGSLDNLIQEMIAPATWVDRGEFGIITFAEGMPTVLQTLGVHAELEQFFIWLKTANDPNAPVGPWNGPFTDPQRDWVLAHLQGSPDDWWTRYAVVAAGNAPPHSKQFLPALEVLLKRLDPNKHYSLRDVVETAISKLGAAADESPSSDAPEQPRRHSP